MAVKEANRRHHISLDARRGKVSLNLDVVSRAVAVHQPMRRQRGDAIRRCRQGGVDVLPAFVLAAVLENADQLRSSDKRLQHQASIDLVVPGHRRCKAASGCVVIGVCVKFLSVKNHLGKRVLSELLCRRLSGAERWAVRHV
jgi:hypothetical protein